MNHHTFPVKVIIYCEYPNFPTNPCCHIPTRRPHPACPGIPKGRTPTGPFFAASSRQLPASWRRHGWIRIVVTEHHRTSRWLYPEYFYSFIIYNHQATEIAVLILICTDFARWFFGRSVLLSCMPASLSKRTISTWPFWTALCSGDTPSLVLALLMSIPASISKCTTSLWPFRAAMRNDIDLLMSARASTSKRTTSACPLWAALRKGVNPSMIRLRHTMVLLQCQRLVKLNRSLNEQAHNFEGALINCHLQRCEAINASDSLDVNPSFYQKANKFSLARPSRDIQWSPELMSKRTSSTWPRWTTRYKGVTPSSTLAKSTLTWASIKKRTLSTWPWKAARSDVWCIFLRTCLKQELQQDVHFQLHGLGGSATDICHFRLAGALKQLLNGEQIIVPGGSDHHLIFFCCSRAKVQHHKLDLH